MQQKEVRRGAANTRHAADDLSSRDGRAGVLDVQTALRHLADMGQPLPSQIHGDEATRLGIGIHEPS